MSSHDAQARRREITPGRSRRSDRARLIAVACLVAAAGVVVAIVLGTTGGGGSRAQGPAAARSSGSSKHPASTTTTAGTPGTAAVPVLAYHVINVPPAQLSASRDLYVPTEEFSAQMAALKAGGWHAVTLDQLQAYWARGTSLGSGKPVVITFDGGYASQYTNALPALKRLGWVGVVNVGTTGLSPSDGGLADSQIHGLLAAGWELGAEGDAAASVGDASQLSSVIGTERQSLRSRFNVAVNWFSYPSGRYDPTWTAAVRAAGFVGSTTVVPGWASPKGDRFRTPRLRVAAGTSPSQLLSQIASAERDAPAPAASSGI